MAIDDRGKQLYYRHVQERETGPAAMKEAWEKAKAAIVGRADRLVAEADRHI